MKKQFMVPVRRQIEAVSLIQVEAENEESALIEAEKYKRDQPLMFLQELIENGWTAPMLSERAQAADCLIDGECIEPVTEEDKCPKCNSTNIANEGPEPEITCHDCSHQWDISESELDG